MTARDIQRKLMIEAYRRRSFTCPNYTPKGWWECDVIEITKAGIFREYEIKLSRADFRADRYKVQTAWGYDDGYQRIERNKHKCLEVGVEGGPNQFWYVCPDGMLAPSEVPNWAGLIFAMGDKKLAYLREVKKAPKLHKVKIDDGIRSHLLRSCYYRFQHWFLFRKEAA